jgi:hypothetical protein
MPDRDPQAETPVPGTPAAPKPRLRAVEAPEPEDSVTSAAVEARRLAEDVTAAAEQARVDGVAKLAADVRALCDELTTARERIDEAELRMREAQTAATEADTPFALDETRRFD